MPQTVVTASTTAGDLEEVRATAQIKLCKKVRILGPHLSVTESAVQRKRGRPAKQSKETLPAEPRQSTVFLDLPAHIRNKIYGHALTSKYPIRISYKGLDTAGESSFSQNSLCSSSLAVALLRTCHSVYEEAASVLYGSNTISIPFLGAHLNQFFDYLGDWTNHIRSIRLERIENVAEFVSAVASLQRLPMLTEVKLSHDLSKKFFKPEVLAEELLPLLLHISDNLVECEVIEGEVLEYLDLKVTFQPSRPQGFVSVWQDKKLRERAIKYTMVVRENLDMLFVQDYERKETSRLAASSK